MSAEHEQKDYFEHLEEVPENVRRILDEYQKDFEENNETEEYQFCRRLLAAVQALGWTFEYYLDAEPFDLRPMTDAERAEYKQNQQQTQEGNQC